MNVSSYGKVWSYDDRAVREMFPPDTIVDIEEKVDGSQFSVSVDGDGQLHMRSKGAELFPESNKQFASAIESAEAFAHLLIEGYTYRFEHLRKPKHNTLLYGRVPRRNLVLYDVEDRMGSPRERGLVDAAAIDLEVDTAPLIYSGPLPSRDEIETMLDRDSFLGGCKVEGVVIKARNLRHLQDGKPLKAKVVADWFKEKNAKDWKVRNPGAGDVAIEIGAQFDNPARFAKAVQRLRDCGQAKGGFQDIGPLLRDLGVDLREERGDEIKEALLKHFWPKIQRRAARGFVEWYMAELRAEAEVTP